MPAGVAGIFGVREAHRKAAEVRARTPATVPDKLVEGCVERRRVHRFPKRLLSVMAEPDNRPRPRFPVAGIASGVAPENGAAFRRKALREGIIQPDKPVLDELVQLRVAERVRVSN